MYKVFTMKTVARIMLAIMLVALAPAPAAVAHQVARRYSVALREHWAFRDIRKLFEASVVTGDPDGGFRPDDTLTREECAVIVARLASIMVRIGKPPAGYVSAGFPAVQTFADVPKSLWSFPYIEATKALFDPGTPQNGSGLFGPGRRALRGELAIAIMNLIGADVHDADISLLSAFSDGDGINAEWRPYIAAAAQKGVMAGDGDGTIRVYDPITRAEACSMVVRAMSGVLSFPEPTPIEVYVPDADSGYYDSFFDGAVFVGDSVTQGLRNYVLSQRSKGMAALGGARFLAEGSYGLRAAAREFSPSAVNLQYQGVAMPLEDCLAQMGAEEVYLMLGMNDFVGLPASGIVALYDKVADKILAKNPDITIRVELCTPITLDGEKNLLNNSSMDNFNSEVISMCARRGLDYIDINTPLKGDDNALRKELSSDNYVHLNSQGCGIWVNALREFARGKYIDDAWEAAGISPEDFPGVVMDLGAAIILPQ